MWPARRHTPFSHYIFFVMSLKIRTNSKNFQSSGLVIFSMIIALHFVIDLEPRNLFKATIKIATPIANNRTSEMNHTSQRLIVVIPPEECPCEQDTNSPAKTCWDFTDGGLACTSCNSTDPYVCICRAPSGSLICRRKEVNTRIMPNADGITCMVVMLSAPSFIYVPIRTSMTNFIEGTNFVANYWTFSGVHALDGASTNADSSIPFPFGSYIGRPICNSDLLITDVCSTDLFPTVSPKW